MKKYDYYTIQQQVGGFRYNTLVLISYPTIKQCIDYIISHKWISGVSTEAVIVAQNYGTFFNLFDDFEIKIETEKQKNIEIVYPIYTDGNK